MNARLTLMAVGIVAAMALGHAAVQSDSARAAFEAARKIESVDGDLRGAIERYREIAAGADRTLAAEALLRMAECYRKLGDAEARVVYERIVREFADQTTTAAAASQRLGDRGIAAAGSDRAVWTGPGVDPFGTVSPDGRYLSYVDWGGLGNVMLRDLVAGTDRALTGNARAYGQLGEASWSVISRDGEHVAYGWRPRESDRQEIRVAALRGTGVPPSRVVRRSAGGEKVDVSDWSPDGTWLAAVVEREDKSSQVAVLTVADGSLRVLKTVAWRGAGKVAISPDGRYLAYALAIDDAGNERHIAVIAVDASRETTVFADASRNSVMGWSEDGHVLFASDRGGSLSLWALPVADGRAAAPAKLVRADIGSSRSLGLTPSGTLYVFKDNNPRAIRVASIDLEAGTMPAPESSGFQILAGSSDGRPAWSPDGRQLVYKSCRSAGSCGFAIRSLDTGGTRLVEPALSGFWGFDWSTDGRSLVTDGTDFKGRRGIYLVDAQTGTLSFVAPFAGAGLNTLSHDGKTLYYRGGSGIVAREVTTGAERAVFRKQAAENNLSLKPSPDGRSIAVVEYEAGGAQTLWIVPEDGGEPRALLRTSGLDGYRLVWTPDSRAVLVKREGTELLLVPLATGQPRTIDVDVSAWISGSGNYALSPDGRQIAFVTDLGKRGPEVWALENVLPDAAAHR